MRKTDTLAQFKSKKAGIGILILLHVVGAAGFLSPLKEWFIYLTPINLIITAGMIWIDTRNDSNLGWPVAIAIFTIGYLVEIIGVKTGLIFGNYSYGDVLGWKFFEVPPLIGLNWLIVVWGGFSLIYSLGVPSKLRWLLTAATVVALDYLIEPVASHFGLWTWQSGEPPLANFIAWFIIAAIMALIFEKYPLVKKPRLGVTAIICQFLFFGVLFYAIK